MYLYPHMQICTPGDTMVCIWQAEDNFWESVLTFQHGIQGRNPYHWVCVATAFSHWSISTALTFLKKLIIYVFLCYDALVYTHTHTQLLILKAGHWEMEGGVMWFQWADPWKELFRDSLQWTRMSYPPWLLSRSHTLVSIHCDMCEVRFIASLDSNSLMTIDTVHNFHVLFGQFVRHLCEMPMEFLHPLKKKLRLFLFLL